MGTESRRCARGRFETVVRGSGAGAGGKGIEVDCEEFGALVGKGKPISESVRAEIRGR